MGIWLVMVSLAGAACPEVVSAIAEAEQATLEARFEDAERARAIAEEALGCARLEPSLLARYWRLEGGLQVLQGKTERAMPSFVAAKRLEPETFAPDLGLKVRVPWEESTGEAGWADVRLEPEPVRYQRLLDAKPWSGDSISAGLHLVQVQDDSGVVRFGELVQLTPGQTLRLSTGLVEPLLPSAVVPAPVVVAAVPAEPVAMVRRRPPALLVGGLAALAVSGTAIGLSVREQSNGISKATDAESLRAARDRQVGFASAGLVVGGFGLAGVAAYVAW